MLQNLKALFTVRIQQYRKKKKELRYQNYFGDQGLGKSPRWKYNKSSKGEQQYTKLNC